MSGPASPRRRELTAVLVLLMLVMPALAVGVVGGYGLGVWTWQMIQGPPGPPSRG